MEGNENKCITCMEEINDEQCYRCDSCMNKMHKNCANLSGSETKCMPLQKRMLLFICINCRELIAKLPYMMKVLDEIKQDIKEMKREKTLQVTTQSNDVIPELKSPAPNSKQPAPTCNKSALEGGAGSSSKSEIPEIRQNRKIRKPLGSSSNAPNLKHMQPIPKTTVVTVTQSEKEEETSTSKINNNNELKWNEVVKRPRKKLSAANRPEPLKGANENTSVLKPATRKSFLFLSGLATDITSENVMEFLTVNDLQTGSSCEKMKTKKEKYVSSFRLTVPHSQINSYLCQDLWPKGVIINHFLNLQHRRMGQISQPGGK